MKSVNKGNSRNRPETSYVFTAADLKSLLEPGEGPFISVYFPAHRRKTEARSDSILYRNLCREVERILDRDYSRSVSRDMSSRLQALDEPEFWRRGSEGVAVFLSPALFRCYRLPMELPSLEVVGGSFHTKPLLRYLQEGLSYHVLALSPRHVALYDGWRDSVHTVPLHDVPASLEEALGVENVAHYRGPHERGDDRLHHVQGGGGDDGKADLEKFFREVVRGLLRNGIKDSRKPLILAAHRHHRAIFEKVAQIPTLLEEGIHTDAGRLKPETISSEARRILKPEYERRIAIAKDDYGLASSRGQGTDRLNEAARAAAEGRVRTLIIESGRRVWGLLDQGTGEVVPGATEKNAHDVDLLDELAELTIARGGDVLVLPKEKMPSGSGLAATYRF